MKTHAKKLITLVTNLERVMEDASSELKRLAHTQTGDVLTDVVVENIKSTLNIYLENTSAFLSANKESLINGLDDFSAYYFIYVQFNKLGVVPIHLYNECLSHNFSIERTGNCLDINEVYSMLRKLIDANGAFKKQMSIELQNAKSASDFRKRAITVDGRIDTIRRVYCDILSEMQECCTIKLEVDIETGPEVIHFTSALPSTLAEWETNENTSETDVDPRVPDGQKIKTTKVIRRTYNSIESFIDAFDPNTYVDGAMYSSHAFGIFNEDQTEVTNIKCLLVNIFCDSAMIHTFLKNLNEGVGRRDSFEWDIDPYYGKNKMLTFAIKLFCFHLVKNGIVSLN